MHLEGTYVLRKPRSVIWEYVTNPENIAKCLPELQTFGVKDPKTFTVTVKAGLAFVRGNFKFDFRLLDQVPPSHSKFEAVGKGAGVSVRLTATLDLRELDANSTELSWKTDAELGGLLGEISPSLLQSTTNKFTEQFFECVKMKLESQ